MHLVNNAKGGEPVALLASQVFDRPLRKLTPALERFKQLSCKWRRCPKTASICKEDPQTLEPEQPKSLIHKPREAKKASSNSPASP